MDTVREPSTEPLRELSVAEVIQSREARGIVETMWGPVVFTTVVSPEGEIEDDHRDIQEDALFTGSSLYPSGGVADGISVPEGGEVASKILAEELAPLLAQLAVDHYQSNQVITEDGLYQLTLVPRQQATAHMEETIPIKEKRGIGTTVSMFWYNPRRHQAYIMQIGDSQSALYRDGEFVTLTEDQHVFGHRLGNAVMAPATVGSVRLEVWDVKPGDVLVMAVDGLWNNIGLAPLGQLIQDSHIPLADRAKTVTDVVLKRMGLPFDRKKKQGYPDDLTFVMWEYVDPLAPNAGAARIHAVANEPVPPALEKDPLAELTAVLEQLPTVQLAGVLHKLGVSPERLRELLKAGS